MKKQVFAKKLTLNKETIATLNTSEMQALYGGSGTVLGPTCMTNAECCTPTTYNNSVLTVDCA